MAQGAGSIYFLLAVMLRRVPPKVRECLIRAALARRRASRATRPEDRDFYAQRELSWLRLAASYEFTEKANDFISFQRSRDRLH